MRRRLLCFVYLSVLGGSRLKALTTKDTKVHAGYPMEAVCRVP